MARATTAPESHWPVPSPPATRSASRLSTARAAAARPYRLVATVAANPSGRTPRYCGGRALGATAGTPRGPAARPRRAAPPSRPARPRPRPAGPGQAGREPPGHGPRVAEPLDDPPLGLLLAHPRRHQLGGGVVQVLLGLGRDPPDVVGRAPQAAEQPVQVALDRVGAHAGPPTTAWTPVENRRHSLRSWASTDAPVAVSSYSRRRRPACSAQQLRSRPAPSSRWRAG